MKRQKMLHKAFSLLVFLVATFNAAAQEILPDFTVNTRGNNKIFISWTNEYDTVSQISIQRSFDSLRNFKTILTVPDPQVPQNGFVDTKAPTPFVYYRLFIVLDSGKYLFSQSKRAFWDTAGLALKNNPVVRQQPATPAPQEQPKEVTKHEPVTPPVQQQAPPPVPERFYVVMRRDSLMDPLPESRFRAFRDSIAYRTRDTLMFLAGDTLLIRPFVPREVFRPSKFVFTEKYGNVMISIPEMGQKKYSIKFFEDDDDPLFEIQQVFESPLLLDKANFQHAGWFKFELYEEGNLKEKHRFYIPKDF
jgi:hypothetical protein